MAEVIGLRGVAPLANGANPSAIEMLKDLLGQAERGEIIALGVAMVRSNGNVATIFCRGHNRHDLIAGCEYLKHDLIMNGD